MNNEAQTVDPQSLEPTTSQHLFGFHPKFCQDVRMAVFLVDREGFKFNAARLLTHSPVLQELLQSRTMIGTAQEGTKDNPIVLDGLCTCQQLAHFFRYLYHESWSGLPIENIQQLIDILHLSHMWEVTAGINFAADKLLEFKKMDLTPAHRLRLATQYGLTSWIDQVVKDLVATPLPLLTKDDKEYLGFKLYSAIAETQVLIDRERKHLGAAPAAPPPSTHDAVPFCDSHNICRQVWTEVWYIYITRALLAPGDSEDAMHLKGIPDALKKLAHPKMCTECKEFFLSWLRNCGWIRKEEELTEQLILDICKFVF